MQKPQNARALTRAAAVISAVMVIVSGVTFAALQSQEDVLKGNTIQTAVANLQLSSDGINFTNSLSGFTFSGLIPGGAPAPANGYPIYLKNDGSTALALKLSIPKPITNPDNADLSKVHVLLTPFGGGAPQNMTLQDLVSSAASGGIALAQPGRLGVGQSTGFNVQVSMESDAVSGPSATITDIDFSFGAATVN